MRPIIEYASQLEEHSSWRHYQRGIRQLELLEAPKSVIQDFKYKAARECFLAFADLMKSGNLKVADFHEIIGAAFEDLANKRYPRLIVSCPPRSGKSMLASMFMAWLLGRDQETQHIISSYGQTLSSKFHKDAIGMLKSPAFRKIFPEWKGFTPDSKYEMIGGGYILPTSVGGVLTGFTAGTTHIESPGVGAMIVDDPLKNSESKAALDTLETWWAEEASTRRTNSWCQMVIATRFHERDLHGLVMERDGVFDERYNPMGWRWLNIAGIIETSEQARQDPLERSIGETHWPSNSSFTSDMLLAQKKTMGSFKFSALYQGMPVAAEGQIVRHSWIQTVDRDQCPEFDVIWIGADCAFEENELSDETALCVGGLSTRDPSTVYVIDIIKGRWGFPDLCAAVKQAYSYYKAKILVIEKAASGRSLIQVLRRETKIPVEDMKPLRSKTVRLQAICPFLEANRVKIVNSDWSEAFIKELTSFPFVKHDDSVDAFVWMLTYYAIKLDAVDRSLQDSIIQLKRFRGDSSGEGSQDSGAFGRPGRQRLFAGDTAVNDPDYSLSDGGSFGGRQFGGRKRGISWGTDL